MIFFDCNGLVYLPDSALNGGAIGYRWTYSQFDYVIPEDGVNSLGHYILSAQISHTGLLKGHDIPGLLAALKA